MPKVLKSIINRKINVYDKDKSRAWDSFEFVKKFYTKRNLNLQLRLFQPNQLLWKNEIESVLFPRKVFEQI